MAFFFNTPIIVAAMISGTAAVIGIFIQVVIFYFNQKRDNIKNFEGILKDKLEKVYTPLSIIFANQSNKQNFLNEDILNIIKANGYLLTNTLFEDFIKLSVVESKSCDDKNSDFYEEHENLKEKLKKHFESEFLKLRHLYNQNFEQYKENYTKSLYRTVFSLIKVSCIITTASFYILLILNYYLKWVSTITLSIKDNNLKAFMSFYTIIIVITSISITGYVCIKAIDKIYMFLKKFKKLYTYDEQVPKTAYYRCRICGETKKLYQHSNFPNCSNRLKLRNILKTFFIFNEWRLTDETNGGNKLRDKSELSSKTSSTI